jgi:hypothetical protein
MTNSVNANVRPDDPPNWFNAACRRCTAKWFSPLQPLRCPRCGSLEPQIGVAARLLFVTHLTYQRQRVYTASIEQTSCKLLFSCDS